MDNVAPVSNQNLFQRYFLWFSKVPGLSRKPPIPEAPLPLGRRIIRACARICKLCLFATFCLWLFASPLVNRGFYDWILWRVAGHYPLAAYKTRPVPDSQLEEAFLPVNNESDSPLIHTWYFPVHNAKKVILFHHGQGGNILDYLVIVRQWLKSGYSVALYDYEGYGRSTGKPGIAALRRDGEIPYKWLIESKGVKAQQIVHVGWSLGTSPAAIIGTKYPCAGIILVSPYASLAEVAHHVFPLINLWPDWMLGYSDIGSRDAMSRPHPPTLMFGGVRDRTIPIEQMDKINASADKHNFTYMRMEKSGHTDFFSCQPAESWKAVDDFMNKLK